MVLTSNEILHTTTASEAEYDTMYGFAITLMEKHQVDFTRSRHPASKDHHWTFRLWQGRPRITAWGMPAEQGNYQQTLQEYPTSKRRYFTSLEMFRDRVLEAVPNKQQTTAPHVRYEAKSKTTQAAVRAALDLTELEGVITRYGRRTPQTIHTCVRERNRVINYSWELSSEKANYDAHCELYEFKDCATIDEYLDGIRDLTKANPQPQVLEFGEGDMAFKLRLIPVPETKKIHIQREPEESCSESITVTASHLTKTLEKIKDGFPLHGHIVHPTSVQYLQLNFTINELARLETTAKTMDAQFHG